nr:F-box/FBD/LRR-repeat protein At1g13570-like [Lolium perenne]
MPPRPRRKTEPAAAATDALLSLPTEVLDDILARVGLRDAVRTSVLSRAWTRRWEFIPSIDISAEDGGMWKAPSAVDGILLRFPGRVRRFHVSLEKATSCRVNDWLPALPPRRRVPLRQTAVAHTADFRPPRLHESVFYCSSLTVLSLSTCTMPSFPMDWGFRTLRSLILSNVRFLEEYGHDQLQEIIETCPLLEDLRLVKVDLYGDIEFVMQAPKLGS